MAFCRHAFRRGSNYPRLLIARSNVCCQQACWVSSLPACCLAQTESDLLRIPPNSPLLAEHIVPSLSCPTSSFTTISLLVFTLTRLAQRFGIDLASRYASSENLELP